MKKRNIVALSLAAAIVFTSAIFVNTDAGAANEVAVYRLESRLTRENLYTTDLNEVRTLSATLVWENEGIEWYAPTSGEGIYRVNNPGGYHLYTKDKNEIKTLKKKGWQVDNGEKPMFYSGGNVDVYRLFNPMMGYHYLTPDLEDYHEYMIQGWEGEGVAIKAVRDDDGLPANNIQPTNNKPATNNTTIMSSDAAIDAALKHAGISRANAGFIKAELDFEDDYLRIGKNPQVYQVEFYSGPWEYEIELDAITGEILKFERDR